jgi:hypothetical protein
VRKNSCAWPGSDNNEKIYHQVNAQQEQQQLQKHGLGHAEEKYMLHLITRASDYVAGPLAESLKHARRSNVLAARV